VLHKNQEKWQFYLVCSSQAEINRYNTLPIKVEQPARRVSDKTNCCRAYLLD